MADLDVLAGLLQAAKQAGADAADALVVSDTSLSVKRRLGKTEKLERSEGRDLGLRVFVGQSSAVVSATSVDPSRFADMARRAVDMARVVPPDPFGGLADDWQPPSGIAALELADDAQPDAAQLLERAAAAEDAARAVAGVTNSEGAEAGYGRAHIALATSKGFAGEYVRTSHSVSVSALAGTGTGMQRDYDFSAAVHMADLQDPAQVGRVAGEKAVRRLNPVRPRTAIMPVVYDPRVSGGLVGHVSGLVNGASVARGTSLFKDRMGQSLFAPGVQIIDDPLRPRGMRSRPFDGEGLPTRKIAIVEDGVLSSWFLDQHSARQLGLKATGHASRGTGGPPSPAPSNLYLAAGALSPQDLMADITEGVYVTELIGSSVNLITGDYSRGAAGFMIRNGQLAEAVAEITIAGNLTEMFARLVPASDLVFRYGINAPTVRIDGLTVAGA